MKENLEKVQLLARDLRNGIEFPRSPRETLGGYVLAARAVVSKGEFPFAAVAQVPTLMDQF